MEIELFETGVIYPLRFKARNLMLSSNEITSLILNSNIFTDKASVIIIAPINDLEDIVKELNASGFIYNISHFNLKMVVKLEEIGNVLQEMALFHGSRNKWSMRFIKLCKKLRKRDISNLSTIFQLIDQIYSGKRFHTMQNIHLEGWHNLNDYNLKFIETDENSEIIGQNSDIHA